MKKHRQGWGLLRLTEAVGRLAELYPGSYDAAVPKLIEWLHEEQPDEMLEACGDALRSIGPAAVPEMAQHLADEDGTRQIFITGALGDIPTEGAAQALLTHLNTTEPPEGEDMVVEGLIDIGSASAIEPLYQWWQTVDPTVEELNHGEIQLAHALLLLCELHGVDKPELPEWRRIMDEENAKYGAESLFDVLPDIIPPEEGENENNSQPKTGSTGKRKKKKKKRRK
jgi:hypothetical protein